MSAHADSLSLRRQATAVLVAVSILIGSGLLASGLRFSSMGQLEAAARRAHEQEQAAEALISALLEAETAQRGFLLMQRPSDLEAYRRAFTQLGPSLVKLGELAAATGWLRPQAAELDTLVRDRIAELAGALQIAETEGVEAARASLLNDPGGERMQQAQALAAQIRSRADLEWAAYARKLQDRQQQISLLSLGALLGGLILLGVAGLRMLWIRAALLRARGGERREAERLAAALENIKDGVAVFDRQGRLVLQNTRFASVLGLSVTPVPGARLDEVAAGTALDPPALLGPPPRIKPIVTESGDGSRVLEVWRSAMPDGGEIIAVADITRRVQAEAIARQAQKMETLGQMTGGIAHDFNNLLQVVSGNLELACERLARGDGSAGLLERLTAASAGVARGAQLTRHLLAFARRQPLAPETLDPSQLLLSIEDMLRRSLGEGVELTLVAGAGAWSIRADAGQLESALLNLTLNARDAMVRSGEVATGRVTIEVANAEFDAAYAEAHEGLAPGEYVMFAVTDNGVGMSKEQLGRALEPFYTTKPQGEGTGLGLAMVFGFAKQSGGHLQLYSEPGTGTTARLYLPRTANPAEAAVLPAGDTPAGRGELVLVVEDDSSVRRVACSALVVLGYNVREAASADEALALLQAGARPSALFTDLIMPGRITARELATKARAMMPGIAVVFTSGYPQEFILREGALESGMAMISKPWRSRDLGRALYNALQASRGRLDRKQRRLLLVEDEPLVRMTTADALAELGFEVVEAEDGLRGLSRLQPPPDLLITDLGLPDIDGLELISRAREMVPGLPAVLTTGRSGRFDGDFVFLAKPYDGRELRAALNAALQAREVAG